MKQYNFSPFPGLSTDRLVLRQLLATDADAILVLRNDTTVNQYLDRPKSTTLNETVQFIEKINKSIALNQSIYWVITLKENNIVVGTICLWNFDGEKNTAEAGYELLPAFHGKGLMQEALKAVLDFAFIQLQLAGINAFTHINNTASGKLLQKNNFTRIGVSEENQEEIIYILNNPLS